MAVGVSANSPTRPSRWRVSSSGSTRENPQIANNDKIEESARRLQDAANAMRRSATGANDGGVSQGASALDRLQEARRLLDENRNGRTARDLDDAVQKAEKIANDQRQIAG